MLPPDPTGAEALFLDVDGTLLDLAPTPETVVVPPGLPALLRRLPCVTLVSGRPVAQLDALFGPGLSAAGVHGLERRGPDGALQITAPASRALDRLRAGLHELVAAWPGLRLEDKGVALALHYRAAPRLGDLCRAHVRQALAAAGDPSLHLLEGKMVLEVKPASMDKGAIVRAFLAEAPHAGRRPVFIGDDVTDEDGFRAVTEAGGYGIKVGAALDASAARHLLPDPAAVRAWLERLP